MGKFINVVNGVKLPDTGKAEAIKQLVSNVTEIQQPESFIEDIVCVVEVIMTDSAT